MRAPNPARTDPPVACAASAAILTSLSGPTTALGPSSCSVMDTQSGGVTRLSTSLITCTGSSSSSSMRGACEQAGVCQARAPGASLGGQGGRPTSTTSHAASPLLPVPLPPSLPTRLAGFSPNLPSPSPLPPFPPKHTLNLSSRSDPVVVLSEGEAFTSMSHGLRLLSISKSYPYSSKQCLLERTHAHAQGHATGLERKSAGTHLPRTPPRLPPTTAASEPHLSLIMMFCTALRLLTTTPCISSNKRSVASIPRVACVRVHGTRSTRSTRSTRASPSPTPLVSRGASGRSSRPHAPPTPAYLEVHADVVERPLVAVLVVVLVAVLLDGHVGQVHKLIVQLTLHTGQVGATRTRCGGGLPGASPLGQHSTQRPTHPSTGRGTLEAEHALRACSMLFSGPPLPTPPRRTSSIVYLALQKRPKPNLDM